MKFFKHKHDMKKTEDITAREWEKLDAMVADKPRLKYDEMTFQERERLYRLMADIMTKKVYDVAFQRAKDVIDPVLKTRHGLLEGDRVTVNYTMIFDEETITELVETFRKKC